MKKEIKTLTIGFTLVVCGGLSSVALFFFGDLTLYNFMVFISRPILVGRWLDNGGNPITR
jgi:hypothetical protein